MVPGAQSPTNEDRDMKEPDNELRQAIAPFRCGATADLARLPVGTPGTGGAASRRSTRGRALTEASGDTVVPGAVRPVHAPGAWALRRTAYSFPEPGSIGRLASRGAGDGSRGQPGYGKNRKGIIADESGRCFRSLPIGAEQPKNPEIARSPLPHRRPVPCRSWTGDNRIASRDAPW